VAPDAFVAPNATVVGRVAVNAQSSVWYGAVVRGDLNTVTIGKYTAIQDRAVVHTAASVEGHVEANTLVGSYVLVGECTLRALACGRAFLRSCVPFLFYSASPLSFLPLLPPSCDPATVCVKQSAILTLELHHPSLTRRHAGPGALLQSCTIQDYAVVGAGAIVMEGALVEKHARLGEGSVVHPGRRIPSGQLWSGNPAVFVRDLSKTEIAEAEGHAQEVAQEAAVHAAEFLPYSTAYRQAEALKIDELDQALAAIKAKHEERMIKEGDSLPHKELA
jgi:carbonic anhydrase/acetyltransferase-like protein (isoleucine patch superfamily)